MVTAEWDTKVFTHCLRIALVPGHFEEARISELLDFCRKYGFRDVAFFINAEEYNQGHITKEEARPWIEAIKRVKPLLNKAGITVSLNPWIEIGHLDRGRVLKEGQDFHTMVDMNGKRCEMVACPLDRNWRAYFLDLCAYMVEEIRPEIYWIEDDFRLHNHGDLEFGGCFCENHMAEFNRRLGKTETREEFVSKVFERGGLTPERRVWLDVSRESMAELASEIAGLVRRVSPSTKVGLMSSRPDQHCMEARDWERLTAGVAAGGLKIDRIHMPYFTEMTSKEYFYKLNSVSMVVRGLLPEDTLVYPELENAFFSIFAKESRFLRFQLEAALPLCIRGMTYDICDFLGNGPQREFGYGKEILSLKPYLQAVTDLNLNFSELRGIVLPIDEKSCYRRRVEKNWRDLYPTEFEFAGYLGSLGVNYRLSREKKFCSQTVALIDGATDNFSDEEIVQLFRDNFVLLDGGAVLKLASRSLLGLIGARSAERIFVATGRQSYEEAVPGIEINGVRGYRASAQERAGDYVRVEYEKAPFVYSKLYDHLGQYVGDGVAEGEGFAVLPFVFDKMLYEQYNELRRTIFYRILLKRQSFFAISEYPGVGSYVYRHGDDRVLMFVNSTLNSLPEIRVLVSGLDLSEVQVIDKQTGAFRSVEWRLEKGILTLVHPLEYLSSETFLLKRGR